jgi:voltage-gated potassium channel
MTEKSDSTWMGPRATAVAARLEPWMLGAALLTIPAIVLEEVAVRDVGRDVALGLNWIIWLAFLGEMVTMLVLVPDRWRWLRTHPIEVAIVVLTPPFLPAPFGLLRLARLLPLLRVVLSARRLLSLQGLRFIGLITLALVLIAGLAFSRVETGPNGEDLSTWDGIWWAITTVTTVGYGELYPQTDTGRALAIAVMVLGIGFVAMLTAAAAEYFVRMGLREAEGSLDDKRAVEDRIGALGERLEQVEQAMRALTHEIRDSARGGPGAADGA